MEKYNVAIIAHTAGHPPELLATINTNDKAKAKQLILDVAKKFVAAAKNATVEAYFQPAVRFSFEELLFWFEEQDLETGEFHFTINNQESMFIAAVGVAGLEAK